MISQANYPVKPNPITQYLTRNYRWLSLREAGLMALGICTISMMGFVLGIEGAVQVSMFIAWVLMLINPLVIAVMSLFLVRQNTSGEQYQLLKVTPLTPVEIRHGFTRAALFRARIQLAVQIGLMPVWVAVMFSEVRPLSTSYYELHSFEYPNVILPMINIMLVWVGLFGLNLLAAVFGVRQGFWSCHIALAVMISLGVVLLIPGSCYIPILNLMTKLEGTPLRSMFSPETFGIIFCLFLPPPYVLTAALYWPFEDNEKSSGIRSHET